MLGQGGFAAAAVKQAQTQIDLKVGNRAAHGGLAFAQLAGGCRERTERGSLGKGGQSFRGMTHSFGLSICLTIYFSDGYRF